MDNPFLRTAYNYDMNAAGDESGLNCKEPTLTKQSFKEEADINTLVQRFNLTGELPTNVRMPTYGDFTTITDFQTAMQAIAQANTAFMEMPADLRARFHNSAAEFVEFCSNDENIPEARKMGLIPATEPAAALTTAPSTPPTTPPPPAATAGEKSAT